MPDFHSSMKERLRTPEQGADTVVWLAVSEAAVKNPSGRFFQGEQTHTHTSAHTQAVLQNLVSRLAVHTGSKWNLISDIESNCMCHKNVEAHYWLQQSCINMLLK